MVRRRTLHFSASQTKVDGEGIEARPGQVKHRLGVFRIGAEPGRLHADPERQLHDAIRDAFLREAGFRVLRFGEEALNSAQVFADIRKSVRPGPSPDA